MTILIESRGLGVTVDSTVLLADINLTVNQGDYVCIIGPNGSGKSTLIRCLTGILPYTEGEILFQGKALPLYPRKKLAQAVSYVPQANGRQLPFEVGMFVKMALYPYHSALSEWKAEDEEAVTQALKMTDTLHFKNRQMSTLSGGECQRVMIAAALCQQAPLMVLDEPASFLDPHHQIEVQKLIQQLNRQYGITIIEVSHDINHACQHASTIMALKQGQLMWQGCSSNFLQVDLLKSLYQQDFILLTHPQTGKQIALPEEQP